MLQLLQTPSRAGEKEFEKKSSSEKSLWMVYEVMRRNKKSKYKYATINKNRYYLYTIRWVDITGDAGHATKEEFDKFEPAYMVSHAYVYKRTSKYLYTFSSFDEKEEVFSDRNIFPVGCIVKLEKILV